MARGMLMKVYNSEDRSLKVNFNRSDNNFKVNLTKTSSNFDTQIHSGGSPTEDLYYDEIVIYDGGGVEGYGYKTN